jgi:hypothetical protein
MLRAAGRGSLAARLIAQIFGPACRFDFHKE